MKFVGINAFSATRTVPSISARTIDKVDCTQAINPAVKTVALEKTQIKGGIKVVFHKVEFSDNNFDGAALNAQKMIEFGMETELFKNVKSKQIFSAEPNKVSILVDQGDNICMEWRNIVKELEKLRGFLL